MKNKHHSEETKRKIGMANTNRPSWKKENIFQKKLKEKYPKQIKEELPQLKHV